MDLGEGAHGLQHFLKLLALPRRQEQLGRAVETRRHALGEIADLQARRRAAGGGDHRGQKRAGHGRQAFRDALDVLVTVRPVPGVDHAASIMTMTGARATAEALAAETLA